MSEQSLTDMILRRTLAVESAGAGLARGELARALDRASSHLARRIAAMEGQSFTRSRYRRIQGELSGVLAELGKRYEGILDRGRLAVVQVEYDKFHREMLTETGRKIRTIPYRLPVAEAKAMLEGPVGGQFLGDWIDAHIGAMKAGIRRELTESLILGETNRDAARRLREALHISRGGADLIARTSLLNASNTARDAVYAKHADVILGYRVAATLDARTCFVCAAYDGLVAKTRAELPVFPIHPRCRCQVVPVTEFENPETQRRAAVFEQESHVVHHTKVNEAGKRVPDGTTSTQWKVVRAGQVSGRTTFREFFERQPAAWQRDYLGKERHDLHKAGKLAFADLARNHRVLTLDQLRRGH